MVSRHKPGFLVLEGLDGTGTTTQARLVSKALQGLDLRVRLTAEPSDGPIGTVCRTHVRGEITLDPPTAALAFCADRADHLARTVRPALLSGEWVVSDRYLLSTLAYQGAEGVDRGWIMEMSRGVLVPDLTVFLDVPEPQRSQRMDGRGARDRYEDPAMSDALYASYLASIDLLCSAGHRIERVEGSGEPEQVRDRILALLPVGRGPASRD